MFCALLVLFAMFCVFPLFNGCTIARPDVTVKNSGPSSPTIADPCVIIPPFAKRGISGMVGMLNPIVCPPPSQSGIQSGISIFMLLIPSIIAVSYTHLSQKVLFAILTFQLIRFICIPPYLINIVAMATTSPPPMAEPMAASMLFTIPVSYTHLGKRIRPPGAIIRPCTKLKRLCTNRS